jgi:hypothetical protein
MAYGVKFRLDFADVKGTAKRVEILQDSYTGSVKELVGTGEPVVIKWEGDDDFYQPIIGSTCTLNLFQTDTTDYDDFFNAPEKEYKVVISTEQTIFDTYKERVQQDGGFVEAKSCIENVLTNYYYTDTAYRKRVFDDGGVVEALDCIGNILTIEKEKVYTTYWAGWLITDQYSEVMAPNPQRLTLKAIDGLGTLDNYLPNVDTNATTIIERLAEAVNNIGLELDVYINNDIKQIFASYLVTDLYYPIEQYENFNATGFYAPREGMKYEIFDGNYNLYDFKEFTEIILSNINGRIFQSNGKWCIVNNSTYSEQRVMDDVQQILQDTSTLPTDVEQRRLNYLKTGTEFTNFRKYLDTDQSSVASEYNYQALSKIKTDVTPLDQSLVREKQRPYKKITLNVEEKRRLSRFNHSFEFGSEYFNVTSGDIDVHDIAKKGVRSYKLTTSSTSASTPSTVQMRTDKQNWYYLYNKDLGTAYEWPTAGVKVQFSHYIDTQNTAQTSTTDAFVWFRIRMYRGATTKYYNVTDKTWSTSSYINKIEVAPSMTDKWIDQNIEVESDDPSFYFVGIYVEFYTPYRGGVTNWQALYIDNVSIYKERKFYLDEYDNDPDTQATDDVFCISEVSIELNSTDNVLEVKNDLPLMLKNYSHNLDSTETIMLNGIAAQPYFVEEKEYNTYYSTPRLYEAVLKQRINDFKTPMTRYEGTFYNNNTEPLSLMSKIWIDYGENILRENNSGIIDGLEYNVKSNEYNVIMHLPNQDNQLDVTIKKQTEIVKKT